MPMRPVTQTQRLRAGQPTSIREQRQSASKRGYDRNWRKLREAYAAVHPAICVQCRDALESAKMHLDHRIAKPVGTDDWANLQWMCEPCHSAKTVREDGGLRSNQR